MNQLNNRTNNVFLLRSTVTPGTTRKLQRKYKQGWDLSTGTWKEGFLDEWYDCD